MSTAPTSFGRRPTRKTDPSRRALAIGLAVSTLGAGILTLTGPLLASATPTGCTDVLAVMTPGTWETTSDADPSVPVGMLASVGNSLKTEYGHNVELFYGIIRSRHSLLRLSVLKFFAPGTTERNAASSGHLPRGARRAPTFGKPLDISGCRRLRLARGSLSVGRGDRLADAVFEMCAIPHQLDSSVPPVRKRRPYSGSKDRFELPHDVLAVSRPA